MSAPASALGTAALPRWKRSLDVTGVLLALPFFGVCFAAVGVLLLLGSPGPVFLRQARIGYKGRTFPLLKFRTMRPDVTTASHQTHVAALYRSDQPMEKLDAHRDPRLVPGGWLLRASGLDELPQIFNVLRGEMSLVGPRPCLPYEIEHFIGAQRQRFDAVPGLTGLWQVSGKNRTNFETMVRLDIAYAGHLSLREDLRIIARTFPVLLRQLAEAVIPRLRARRGATMPPPDAATVPIRSEGTRPRPPVSPLPFP